MTGANYHDLRLHRRMLEDTVRNEAYRQALAKLVKPGDVVLDVGAGTGIMSLFAAKAGAAKVYAVERTPTAEMALEIIHRNGLENRIQVIEKDIEDVELPEKVDVIVSEWMGGYGIDENVHTPVLLARDRWLKPGGKMIPTSVTAWMAPVWNPQLDRDLAYWRGHPHELDFSPIAEAMGEELYYCRQDIKPENLLAAPLVLWTTDMASLSLVDAGKPHWALLSFTAEKAGTFTALATWFTAEMAPGMSLSAAPEAPPTHWGQTLFLQPQPTKLVKGDTVQVKFTCEPAGPGFCRGGRSVRVNEGVWEYYGDHQQSKK
jgi:SAM-dependent methyltransferase